MKNKLYKLPELYEKLQNNNLKQTISSIRKILKIINNPNGAYLDLGCGTGQVLNKIIGQARGIGIDLSKEMIHFAKKKYYKRKLKFMCKSFDKIDYETNFDFIFSTNDCLNYIPPKNWNSLFLKVKKSLKDRAYFYFDFTTYSDFYDVWPNHYQIIEKNYVLCIKNHFYNKKKRIGKEVQRYFIKNKNNNFSYHKEEHILYSIKLKEIIDIINNLNFELINFYDPVSIKKPKNLNNHLRLGCLIRK